MAVVLIHYPAEAARLDELRTYGLPRLLLVDEAGPAPELEGIDEDWIRLPAHSRDLAMRVETLEELGKLQSHKPLPEPPRVDESELLHHGDRWVALSSIEARLIRALIDRFGSAVRREALIDATWPDDKVNPNILNVHMVKLRRRIECLGLTIHTLRGYGYLLDSSTGRY